MNPKYPLFAEFICHNPTADCGQAIAAVMRASGGSTDPNDICDWWLQWQEVMKRGRGV